MFNLGIWLTWDTSIFAPTQENDGLQINVANYNIGDRSNDLSCHRNVYGPCRRMSFIYRLEQCWCDVNKRQLNINPLIFERGDVLKRKERAFTILKGYWDGPLLLISKIILSHAMFLLTPINGCIILAAFFHGWQLNWILWSPFGHIYVTWDTVIETYTPIIRNVIIKLN